MGGRAASLALLWALSAVAVAAGQTSGASRMVLAMLPWIAAAGVPRTASGSPGFAAVELALALPCAALGLRLDLASGFELRERIAVAGITLLLAALLATAARRATRSTRAHAVHAVAWLALVPGLPLLALALREGGRPLFGEPIGALAALAGASPLAWSWRAIAPREEARVAGPLLVCIALWLCSARSSDRRS